MKFKTLAITLIAATVILTGASDLIENVGVDMVNNMKADCVPAELNWNFNEDKLINYCEDTTSDMRW